MSAFSRTRMLIALGLVAAFAGGAGLASALGETQTAPTAVRIALAETAHVQGAPNRTLVLSRVVVPPGAELALHHHLGSQVAHIQSGVLNYTVRSGSVVVRTGEAGPDSKKVRKIAAGQTGRLSAGQWIVEQPSDIHEAANRTGKPVTIYLATLLKTGAPPATPVATP